MIKAVIFDTDGVIVNPAYMFSKNLSRDYGITAKVTEPFFSGIFQECLVGKADLKKELEPYLFTWGWKKSLHELLQYWFKSEHVIDNKIVEYIQSLRKQNIKCYVATNQERYRTEYLLNEMGFKNLFDKVFSSAHVGYVKPQKKFFQIIINELKPIKSSEIVFWDDSKSYMQAAKESGLHAQIYIDFEDFKKKMEYYLGTSKAGNFKDTGGNKVNEKYR